MAAPESSNGNERALRLLERDDRGVFGPEGIPGISASMRRKFKTATLPARTRAFILIRERKFDEAERLLSESLPRDEHDAEDDRYFGIYCGLADVSYAKNDKLAALAWFRQGIERFPSSIRQNHLLQLSNMGVDVSRWIRAERDDGLSETDSAAVLQQILLATEPFGGRPAGAAAEDIVRSEFARLETGAVGDVARSRVKSYLG